MTNLEKAIANALDALMNVPEVGHKYDQQHSDTHISAYLELRAAYLEIKGQPEINLSLPERKNFIKD